MLSNVSWSCPCTNWIYIQQTRTKKACVIFNGLINSVYMQVTVISSGTVCCFCAHQLEDIYCNLCGYVKGKFTKQLKTKIKGGGRKSLQQPFLQMLNIFIVFFHRDFTFFHLWLSASFLYCLTKLYTCKITIVEDRKCWKTERRNLYLQHCKQKEVTNIE